jgi:hypothetical protein
MIWQDSYDWSTGIVGVQGHGVGWLFDSYLDLLCKYTVILRDFISHVHAPFACSIK